MKIMTILGTRPEIIRLSRIMPKLDVLCEHIMVHTGQNFDRNLNELFFEELGLREPDHLLGCSGSSPMGQVGRILEASEQVMLQERPDRLLILGDTNSALSAIAAKRLGIPVYHMEAGNRCYDDRVPEEVNRRIIDHSSDILLPYTERSRQNLLREGIPGERIYVTGNPINEVINYYQPQITKSRILEELCVEAGKYFLVTMHRAENVDIKERIESLTQAFARLQKEYGLPFIISTHPRTKVRMEQFSLSTSDPMLRFMSPFGFFDFIALERNAYCVLSDSGTVQEECAIFGVPNVTLRDVTERPETVECGSNILSGAGTDAILSSVKTVLKLGTCWRAPQEYLVENVSNAVCRIAIAAN
ncbi:UDP-N-acetylglucosamine 2-epimerase (non-hydrolyzing) [Trichlorobacter lovleyi]|uniref:non-hydrolyzing UDP-N-acetylglucosamine 2-epimerase n=1 Tax=Trichlorobacter lovleyi TaxID=313985 RepID=UPI0022403958|nr:UDP-N-acetylglucosamine 2-epimerase (non-hydrolyzing) [Trichlorobacter lovleyi]QOX80362.1 UDP-N-acetylglucosamine 2-epimerase (non-hydrolyzing) [Trichlorobacter lovleyi]